MRLKISIILISLFFLGCSKTNKFYKKDNIILNQKELQEIKNINIYKYGKFLFYAYLKNGLELTRVSKKQLSTKNNEEVIRVYENAYYPIYNLSRDTQDSFCGANSITNYDQVNYNFCKSHYLTNAYLSNTIADEIAGAITTLGIYNIATGDKHIAKFDHNKFKKYIVKSKLPKFKKIISEKLIDNSSVYIVSKIIPHQLKNNIIEISSLEEKISGLILSDKDNNIYNIISFNEFKNTNTFKLVSILTQKLIDSYLKPNKFLLKKIDSNITLIQSSSENTIKFKKRLKEEYQKQKEDKLKLRQLIIKEQIYKKKNIEKFVPYFTKIALQSLIGKLYIKSIEYNADKKKIFLKIDSTNSLYSKEAFFTSNEIKDIENHYNDIQPIVKYQFSKNNLVLNNIDIIYNKHIYKAEIGKFEKVKPIKVTININIDNNLSKNSILIVKDIDERISDVFFDFQDDLPKLLATVPQASKDSKKWLFAIGAEKYDNTDSVTYSKRSAEIFVKVAKKSLGVTNRNSYELIGSSATSGAIEDKLKLMLRNIKKGDSIYFYYSGHGIPVLPNRVPYLLPKDKIPDYIGNSPFFKLSNIYNLLSNSKADKVIAIIDSCFSGSTDGKSVFKGVAGSVLIPKKVTFNQNKMVVFSAGRDKQFSNMYPKRGHRLFSYFVMKALLEGKRDLSNIYNEVYSNVRSISNGFGDLKRQEPTIEGNKKLRF